MALVGGDPEALDLEGPAVPGGLAVKLYPCCYALQRPISAVVALPQVPASEVEALAVHTPASSLQPLIHHAPRTGLEGKFSLEYGIAAGLLDRRPGLESFDDAAVGRPEARRLIERIEVVPSPGGEGLLSGEVAIEVSLRGGEALEASLALPPGAPDRPASEDELAVKLAACAPDGVEELQRLDWDSARGFLSARG